LMVTCFLLCALPFFRVFFFFFSSLEVFILVRPTHFSKEKFINEDQRSYRVDVSTSVVKPQVF